MAEQLKDGSERAPLASRSPGVAPSPGTPGEGGGEGDFEHAGPHRVHEITLTPTLSRNTGRGSQKAFNTVGTTPALELKSVGVLRGETWLVRDISWSVAAGTVAAILGPNGCGKSTMARLLTGYLFPTTGTVRVLGQTYGSVDLNQMREDIRLIQAGGPFEADPDLTARQIVQTGAFGTIGLFRKVSQSDIDRADVLVKQVGLDAVADRMWNTLSSGERVRTLLARAFLRPPKLLLLDEVSNGLDLLAREQMLAALQRVSAEAGHRTTMIMITHHLEELLPATTAVLLLKRGHVAAAGPMATVLTDQKLSAAYECPVTVHVENGRYYPRVDPAAWKELV